MYETTKEHALGDRVHFDLQRQILEAERLLPSLLRAWRHQHPSA